MLCDERNSLIHHCISSLSSLCDNLIKSWIVTWWILTIFLFFNSLLFSWQKWLVTLSSLISFNMKPRDDSQGDLHLFKPAYMTSYKKEGWKFLNSQKIPLSSQIHSLLWIFSVREGCPTSFFIWFKLINESSNNFWDINESTAMGHASSGDF